MIRLKADLIYAFQTFHFNSFFGFYNQFLHCHLVSIVSTQCFCVLRINIGNLNLVGLLTGLLDPVSGKGHFHITVL